MVITLTTNESCRAIQLLQDREHFSVRAGHRMFDENLSGAASPSDRSDLAAAFFLLAEDTSAKPWRSARW